MMLPRACRNVFSSSWKVSQLPLAQPTPAKLRAPELLLWASQTTTDLTLEQEQEFSWPCSPEKHDLLPLRSEEFPSTILKL